MLEIRKGAWGLPARSAGQASSADGVFRRAFKSSDGHRHLGTMMVQAAVNLLGSYLYCGFFRRRKDLQHCDAAVPVSWSDPGYRMWARTWGAGKDQKGSAKGVRITQVITIIAGIVCGLAVFIWGGTASRLFVADPTGEIKAICDEYFHATAWCYPFLGSIFIIPDTRLQVNAEKTGWCPCSAALRAGSRDDVNGSAAPPSWDFLAAAGSLDLALIPLVPVYIMRMKKITKTYSSAEVE